MISGIGTGDSHSVQRQCYMEDAQDIRTQNIRLEIVYEEQRVAIQCHEATKPR